MALPKMPPMKKAGATPKAKTEKKAAAPKKVAETSEKKPHARKAKPSEEERIARGKAIAVSYLAQRDGMELDMANMIVESMTPDEVNELTAEAATAVLDKGTGEAEPATEEEAPVAVNFLEVPALAEYEFEADDAKFSFPELVTICVEKARLKNDSEKEYKAAKKLVMDAMKVAKTPLVDVFGVGLAVYKGGTSTLSEEMLLEAGVDADTIAKGWKKASYDDVRITVPKEG